MKQYLLYIIILLFKVSASQDGSTTIKYTYLLIDNYKLKYGDNLTAKDSLNFLIKDGDTLVLVKSSDRPKGVSVPYEFKDSTFLHFYKKIAFYHKNDSIDKRTSMKYWKENIRIFFSESISRKTKKNLMSFANMISKSIDSLNISEVKSLEDSNYVIYNFDDYEYEEKLRNKTKSDFYVWWRNNQIYRASIKLNNSMLFNDNIKQFKLRKYFLQTLGYFNFIDDFTCDSYFANCYSSKKEFTKLDMELLKYHYSYGICKGVSLETFEKQHEEAKKILKQNDVLIRFFHPF